MLFKPLAVICSGATELVEWVSREFVEKQNKCVDLGPDACVHWILTSGNEVEQGRGVDRDPSHTWLSG